MINKLQDYELSENSEFVSVPTYISLSLSLVKNKIVHAKSHTCKVTQTSES